MRNLWILVLAIMIGAASEISSAEDQPGRRSGLSFNISRDMGMAPIEEEDLFTCNQSERPRPPQHAQPHGATRASGTQFSQLEAVFSQGTFPQKEDLLGWYSGRCFSKHSRNSPQNSLLIGWEDRIEGDGGPLFPAQNVPNNMLRYLSIAKDHGADDNPSYFDHPLEEDIETIKAFQESDLGKQIAGEALEDSGSLVRMTLLQPSDRWHLRKHLNYLVLKTLLHDELVSYCYYFKKIR